MHCVLFKPLAVDNMNDILTKNPFIYCRYTCRHLINYNSSPVIKNKGSAIFLHLTKNYKPTAGCIAIKKNDFFKLIKIINNKTKIKI